MSRYRIFIFLGIVCLFLFIANWVVFASLASMFAISVTWQLWLLGIVLGVLSLRFIVASILGMKYYNIFTRLLYLTAAVWMGFFTYLFFVSAIYAILIFVPGSAIIGQVLLVIAVVASIYGVIHARKIYVAKVAISLPNLPAFWQNKKAVFISDLHLGQIRGAKFVEEVVQQINALAPEIVFIGGDLFDGTTSPDLRAFMAPLRKLNVPKGIYFITGNHEEFGNPDKFISAVKEVGIEVLQDRKVEIDGLQIIGADYETSSDREAFRIILNNVSLDRTRPSILIKHEPKDLDIDRDAGVSLQLSGHTHRAQQWPLGYLAHYIYKGFSYGLKRLGDMQVYTSSGVGTWGPPLRVGTDSEIVVITLN
jgi:predicted MPP superfamily phosphohydrolase